MSTDAIFSEIAQKYDRNNVLLSLGLCKLWNRKLVRATKTQGVLLDLCAGTGDIAFRSKAEKVILLDTCQEMLDAAKTRASRHGCSYLQADAQDIPLDDACIDAVTTAYGIRNIQDPIQCGKEVLHVLKPGGVWGILELTRPNPPLSFLHQFYLKQIVAKLGEAYQYLAESILAFTSPDELGPKLLGLGFSELTIQPLTFGIATLMVLKK